MTDTDRLLRAILNELRAIRLAIAPPQKTEKRPSAAIVVTAGDDTDVPRQLTPDERRAQAWMEDPDPRRL